MPTSSGEQILRDYVSTFGKHSDFKDFEDRIHDGISSVLDTASRSVTINDAYGNSLTASGTDDKVKTFSTYGFDNSTLNWPLWLSLYNDSWVFRRAIDKPAQDEVNSGFILQGKSDYTKVYKLFNEYRFDLIQLLQWGALFGGSIAVMMFDGIDDSQLTQPLSKKQVKGRKMKLYVTDRWYGVSPSNDLVTNMKDLDFGNPKYYNISFADGKQYKVHHSYVLRYEHRTAPKLIKCGQLQGWGYAEGSHILNELSRDDQLKSAITSLVNKSLIEVIKMAGMRGVFMGADKGNEEQLAKRLEMVNWARTYNSLTFLDKDDSYEKNELSNISGLSQLLETNMWLVAAALEMQGILFGDLKGGLSQESDAFHRYSVTIKNRCDSYYRPVLRKLLGAIFAILNIDEVPAFEFKALDADIENVNRVDAIQKFGGMLDTFLNQGVISKYQAAIALQNFMNKGVINLEFSDIQLNKLQFEADAEILMAYKTAGRTAPTEILGNQFPESPDSSGMRYTPASGSEYGSFQENTNMESQQATMSEGTFPEGYGENYAAEEGE